GFVASHDDHELRGYDVERLATLVAEQPHRHPAVRAGTKLIGDAVGLLDTGAMPRQRPAAWMSSPPLLSLLLVVGGRLGRLPEKAERHLALEPTQLLRWGPPALQVRHLLHEVRVEIAEPGNERDHGHDELQEARL